MRAIAAQVTDDLKERGSSSDEGFSRPKRIGKYRQLIEHVAKLAYLNKDFLLFFRGQGIDYLNKSGSSTIYPSIYRGERLTQDELTARFDLLYSASKRLCDALSSSNITGASEVRKRKYIQWSILQHYEICPTPLLDLTHSLVVACSFAQFDSLADAPTVYIFGLPYITNRVSINSEYDLAVIRLLSICPPEALRPYFQDGYLAGTDDITDQYESKDELDFNRLLIAKFRISKSRGFWGTDFHSLPRNALYPENDTVENICNMVRNDLGSSADPGRIGQFLQAWTEIESRIVSAARGRRENVYSLKEALNVLQSKEILPFQLATQIESLRQVRNKIVHTPNIVRSEGVIKAIRELNTIKNELVAKRL